MLCLGSIRVCNAAFNDDDLIYTYDSSVCAARNAVATHAYDILNYTWNTDGYILLYNNGETMFVAQGTVRGIPYSLNEEPSFEDYKNLEITNKSEVRINYPTQYGSRSGSKYGMACAAFVTDCIHEGQSSITKETATQFHGHYSQIKNLGGGYDGFKKLRRGDYIDNYDHVKLVVDVKTDENGNNQEIKTIEATPPWYPDPKICTGHSDNKVTVNWDENDYEAYEICKECDACKENMLGTRVNWMSFSSFQNESYDAMQVTYPDDDEFIPDSWIKIDNDTNFPDSAFREYVRRFDTDGDGYLTDDERNAVIGDMGEATGPFNKGIKSLKGIEYFPNVEWLFCYGNELTELYSKHLKNFKNYLIEILRNF